MDLRTVLRLIRDRWASIVVLTLLATATATVLVSREAPVYSAQATLYVSSRADPSNPALAYQGSLLSQQQVASYAQLIHTQRVLSEAARTLGSGETAQTIAARVSATVVPDTSLILITATGATPSAARDTANVVAQNFVAVLPALEGSTGDATAAVGVNVVNAAGLPAVPVYPRPLRTIMIGALLGLLTGLALAAARQALDQTIKSIEEAQHIAAAPVLGRIPRDPAAPRNPLLAGADAHRGRVEAFRKITASLRFMDVERRHGVLLVTSPNSREGKSTTACNLALTLARSGRRVIVVDADLRRPKVAEYLGLPNGAGLTSVLVGTHTLEDATQTWGDELFDVLSCGPVPPNPTEILGSQPMRDLLDRLRATYDDVVVDAPPVLPVADAAVAAAACDGVIMVARHGHTRRGQLQQAVATMRATQTPVLGVIVNQVPSRRPDHYDYHYAARPDAPSERVIGPWAAPEPLPR